MVLSFERGTKFTMSSILKRKKKKQSYGLTKSEQKSINQHNRQYAGEEKMIKENFKHLQFMGYMTLRDRYDFERDGLIDFYKRIKYVFEKYESNELSTKEMLTYCEGNKIDVYGWVNSITQQQKLKLADCGKHKGFTLDLIKVLDASILIYGMISASVLKEIFNFSSETIEEFYGHISYYIDSYVRNYLNDDMINEIMKEECDLDLYKGED